ncbi:MAG: FecR domain-containing protein [Tannerella sp.]|jgi:ferric-dicitrate binding protein FerR (iron transport regulator)|nr:FecR domain-containing protein [Tannerella sp.]
MKENTGYTIADLLEDGYFISSVNRPTAESEAYWAALRREGRLSDEDYELARYCVRSFRPSGRKLTKEETDNLWVHIRRAALRRRSLRRRRLYVRTAAAAAACVLALAGWFVFHSLAPADGAQEAVALAPQKIEDVARPDSTGRDIQIVFSGDERLTLKEKTAEIKYNEKGEAEVNSQAVPQAAAEAQASYNQVIVPQGRHTSLTLSDGSKLWLNASSRVVYPPVFDGKQREIYLEGEAYLEVTPDAGSPFTVKTKQMEIRVRGTSFNVAAYEDEPSQSVVLVTGSVSVHTGHPGGQAVEMAPNQLFRVAGTETQLHDVAVENYISWKDGIYLYRDEKLSLILKRLAHYYGVEIGFAPEVGEMRFTGKLDLKNDAERVLNGLSNTAPVRCRKTDGETFYLNINPSNK